MRSLTSARSAEPSLGSLSAEPTSLESIEPWIPDPRLPHAFQQAQPIYIRTVHHQIFTTVCILCGRGRRDPLHLAAEAAPSRWPI